MMKNLFYFLVLILSVCVALLGTQSCQHDSSPTSSSESDTKPVPTETSTSETTELVLYGTLIGTVTNSVLPNVEITLGSQTTQTDAEGKFEFTNVEEGDLSLEVSGDNVYSRVAVVSWLSGENVEIDAIEKDSEFDLGFYRELARGNHPTEQHMYPLQRWMHAPTFYIDTNPTATSLEEISKDTIEEMRQLIVKMTPIFTGEVFEPADIQLQYFTSSGYDFSLIPENTIVISFDDTLIEKGAMGVTFTDPSFQSEPTGALSKAWIFIINDDDSYQSTGMSRIELLAHEMGHAFGFRHTSLLPSVMMKVGVFGGTYSGYDQLHMSIVYHRPFGNTDIDDDSASNQKSIGELLGRQAFIDRAPSSFSLKRTNKLAELNSPSAQLFSTVPSQNISE